MTASELLAEARRLPVEEQDWVANELLTGGCQFEAVEAAWGEEIKRRIDEIDSGTVELISEDEAMRRFEEHRVAKKRG